MTMENSDDIRLIVKIAQLYYEQDMTQAQIARELGIYRTTISRLLKRGREQGIVTIAINYDYNENLWLGATAQAKIWPERGGGCQQRWAAGRRTAECDGPAWRPACRSVAGARRYHRFFMGPRRAFAGGEPAAGQPVTPGDLRPHHRWTFR